MSLSNSAGKRRESVAAEAGIPAGGVVPVDGPKKSGTIHWAVNPGNGENAGEETGKGDIARRLSSSRRSSQDETGDELQAAVGNALAKKKLEENSPDPQGKILIP